MSDSSGQHLGSHIMLTETNMSQWESAVINKALLINAYDILIGTETLSTVGTDATAMASFNSRQSRLADNITSTLNEGCRALLENANPKIAPDNAHGIWTLIVNDFKAITTNSRFRAIRELMTLRRGDVGHENESYWAWGARCLMHGNSLKNLLPADAVCTAENSSSGSTPYTSNEAFTVRDLVDEITMSVIIFGLGFEEEDKQLGSTLIHVGVGSLTKLLEKLHNADMLALLNRRLD